MADLLRAKKLCIDLLSHANPEKRVRFDRFEYAMKLFLAVNPYVQRELTMAIGYMFFLTEILDRDSNYLEIEGTIFSKTGQTYTPSELKIYLWCKEDLVNVLASSHLYELTDDDLQKLNFTTLRYESRPLFLALAGEKFGFGQLEAAVVEKNSVYSSSFQPRLPKARFLEGFERLVLRLLVSAVQIDEKSSEIICKPKCDGDNCKGSWRGAQHVGEWAIFCPNCGDSELYCEDMKQYLHYSSNALPITFTKSCNHFIFETRNCEVIAIQALFSKSDVPVPKPSY